MHAIATPGNTGQPRMCITLIARLRSFVSKYLHWRALVSELRRKKEDWPWLIKLIEHTINHRPQRRLQWHAPVTVMTGLPADNPLDVVFHNQNGDICDLKLPTPSDIETHIATLQESLASMHKSIVQTTNNERQAHRNSD